MRQTLGEETIVPDRTQEVSLAEKPLPDIATKSPTCPEIGLRVIAAAACTGGRRSAGL